MLVKNICSLAVPELPENEEHSYIKNKCDAPLFVSENATRQ